MKRFRKFLARLFDLVLSEDHNLLQAELNTQRASLEIFRVEMALANQRIEQEKAERLKLQELLFKQLGIVKAEETQQIPAELLPVRTGRDRWSNLRGRLESDDRKRVDSEKPQIRPYN